MHFSLPLQIFIRPSSPLFLRLQRLPLLLVQPEVDRAQKERDDQLDAEEDHYGNFSWDIGWGVLWLEDLWIRSSTVRTNMRWV